MQNATPRDESVNPIADADKVVIKVGTSSVTQSAKEIDLWVVGQLAEDVADLLRQGKKVVIVTSGARVMGEAKGIKDPRTAAGVGWNDVVNAYARTFERLGIRVEPILLESRHFRGRRVPFFGKREVDNVVHAVHTAWKEITGWEGRQRVVPLFNENDPIATEKTTLGDNDKLARRLAIALKAQTVIFLSRSNSTNGRGGAASKTDEIRRLLRRSKDVRLVDGKDSHVVLEVFNDSEKGVKAVQDLLASQRRESAIRRLLIR